MLPKALAPLHQDPNFFDSVYQAWQGMHNTSFEGIAAPLFPLIDLCRWSPHFPYFAETSVSAVVLEHI